MQIAPIVADMAKSSAASKNMLLKTPPTKKDRKIALNDKNKGLVLGKRSHREVIDEFESIYRVFKRRRRQNDPSSAAREET